MDEQASQDYAQAAMAESRAKAKQRGCDCEPMVTVEYTGGGKILRVHCTHAHDCTLAAKQSAALKEAEMDLYRVQVAREALNQFYDYAQNLGGEMLGSFVTVEMYLEDQECDIKEAIDLLDRAEEAPARVQQSPLN